MTARRSSGAPLAWGVPVLAEGAALARSVAFAWLIGPDELGQAMMLALTLRLVEMGTDVGADRLLVQAPDGNGHELQAGLHGASILRGVIASVLLLGLAPLLAGLFQDGPDTASYTYLAAVPLVRAGLHLDFRRAERRFRYRAMAIVEAGATFAMLFAILPAVAWFGDHRAMVAALLAHALAQTALSHLVARRAYAASFNRKILLRCWRFGAPLILNALLLFLTFYADRGIVAHAYDWSTLALYGIVFQLAMLPAQIVGRAASSLLLPRLRAALCNRTLPVVWSRTLAVHSALAAGIGLGFAWIAPDLIGLVYGDNLRPDPMLAIAVAAAAAFRILRTPYSQRAVALGRTGDPARANAFRAAALIPASLFAAGGAPLFAIGFSAALGEAAATLCAHRLATKTTARTYADQGEYA